MGRVADAAESSSVLLNRYPKDLRFAARAHRLDRKLYREAMQGRRLAEQQNLTILARR